jgi:photosystem II stability/assembly factor-like uncharacterized protein
VIKTLILIGSLLAALIPAWAQATQAPLLQLDVTHAGNRLVSVGDRGSVLYSDDQGRHWQPSPAVPSQQLLTALYFVDADHGWAVGHDAQILATQDGGVHWALQFEDPSRQAPLLDVWFQDRAHGFAVGAYGALLQTDDGGAHWQDRSDTLDNPDQLHLNAIAAVKGGALLIVGEAGSLFRSTDQGRSWQRLPFDYDGSLFGVLATAQANTLLVYGLRGHLYRSADNGDSWQAIGIPGNHPSLSGGSLQADGSLVLVGDAGSVLRSTDDGRHFSLQQRPDRLALASVTGTADGALVLVGLDGVQRVSATGAAESVQP